MVLRSLLALVFILSTACSYGDGLSLKSIHVPEGYKVELAAPASLVRHPMMADFDEQGRLYVAANAGENLPRAELEKQLPNFIRRLEDTDGDGVFDQATTFADRMTFPQGCLWLDGSLYVASSGAIWKLTDTDDDGVADQRQKLVGDFGYTGNAADVHGPFLGPEGRIYWCEGRHGHEILDDEGKIISKGKAARIFSCRTDGSDVQTFATGGMDNPVEIVFTPEGDMLGTVNLMYAQPRGDCLVHWQYGGVYPREDFAESLEQEFIRTGPLLPELYNFGHVAVSGLCQFEGNGWGPDTSGSLFVTQFNTNRVVQVHLKPHKSTYEVKEVEDFLVSSDKDFHPTDVLQSPDGSLLVINTGGWFRIGCPQSSVAKSHIHGGIYRIRRTELTQQPANDTKPQRTSDIEHLWQIRRKASNKSLSELGKQLKSENPTIRQIAARALLDVPPGPTRDQSIPQLAQLAAQGSPSERRNAIATLSRWEVNDDQYTSTLLEILPHTQNDPMLHHAVILGLIRGGRRDLLRQAVLDPNPTVSGGASLALAELHRLSEKKVASQWLDIPAPSLGEPLTLPQQQMLLQMESRLDDGNPIRGREVFFSTQATCSKCHRVADRGGQVGPNLSTIGRSRSRRDLLESILFPSATFARGFAPYIVATSDGKTHSGIILGEGTDQLRLGLDQEKSISLPNASIEAIRGSNSSIMPADIQKTLSERQLADLLAFLQSL
ncbi:Cytochrome c [Bremerella volcania]|uniref:Cytochrome c n=1 Tax=Bremerella volcania TaxID=2527984 RepID=A0A518C999_9BACT|nr:PVC-type heme-binding CxxCH protein [Bremerella volcania]QDU75806.1 Cytochrome c [Bremerella volcania]